MLEILNSEFFSSILLLQHHLLPSTHHSHNLKCLSKTFHNRLLLLHILVALPLSFCNAYHNLKIVWRFRGLAHKVFKSLDLSSLSEIDSRNLYINGLYFQCKSKASSIFFQWRQISKSSWFPSFKSFCFSSFHSPYQI